MIEKFFIGCTLREDLTGVDFNHTSIKRVVEPLLEKDLIMTLEVFKNKRSDNQNRYLHGVVLPTIRTHFKETQGTTMSNESIKSYIYLSVLGNEVKFETILGKEVMILDYKHFSDMKTDEFNEAVKKVQSHFAEKGCDIKDPTPRNIIDEYL